MFLRIKEEDENISVNLSRVRVATLMHDTDSKGVKYWFYVFRFTEKMTRSSRHFKSEEEAMSWFNDAVHKCM